MINVCIRKNEKKIDVLFEHTATNLFQTSLLRYPYSVTMVILEIKVTRLSPISKFYFLTEAEEIEILRLSLV
jgi:hypothetical protein